MLNCHKPAAASPEGIDQTCDQPPARAHEEADCLSDCISGRLVTCNIADLLPHPAYVRHRLAVPAIQMSALADQGESAFREPLVITRDRIVVDGYARLELARLKNRPTLPCIEYELTEDAALGWLLLRHCRSKGLNDFCRISLAFELEPHFKEQALSNQRRGGRLKALSNLTEDAAVDVRRKIADLASVSVGNVTKVKQLIKSAHPEILLSIEQYTDISERLCYPAVHGQSSGSSQRF